MEINPLLELALPMPRISSSGTVAGEVPPVERAVPSHLEGELPADDDPDLIKLKQVARDFEALFIGMLLRSMRNTIMESDLFDPEGEGKYYRELHDDELARRSAEQGGGFGVADLIVQQYAARLAAERAYGTEMASLPPQEE